MSDSGSSERGPDRPLPGVPPTVVPPLHVVTDSAVLAGPEFLDTATAVLRAGGARIALHLRGSEMTARRIWELARDLLPVARDAGALLLLNDRVDVALVGSAAGVHLGVRSLPPAVARELLGPDALIGVSVHSAQELERAVARGANYAIVGTLFGTASHPGREGIGWAGFQRIVAGADAAGVPLLGIGGITPRRAADAAGAGAYGVAALSGIWSAPDPGAAVVRYLEVLERNGRPGTEGR